MNWIELLSPLARSAVRQAMTTRDVSHGTNIYRQGEPGTTLFEILDGHVAVVRLSADGEETLIAIFGPGDCIGEQSLAHGEPRQTGARACGAVRLGALGRGCFEQLRKTHPEVSDRLLEFVARRLGQTVALLTEQRQFSLSERLLRRLLILAGTCGRPVGETVEIELRLSQGELAKWVGASRQRVNMAVQDLQRAGIICWPANRSPRIDVDAAVAALRPKTGSALTHVRPSRRIHETSAAAHQH